MARKKPEPKPLFSLKGDFYASLDNAAQQVALLMQFCETLLDLKQVTDKMAPMMRERLDAVRRAFLSRDEDADETSIRE